jgi:hypothetical protein
MYNVYGSGKVVDESISSSSDILTFLARSSSFSVDQLNILGIINLRCWVPYSTECVNPSVYACLHPLLATYSRHDRVAVVAGQLERTFHYIQDICS